MEPKTGHPKAAQLEKLVAELRALTEGARSLPMSSSALVDRSELLDLLSRLEAALPAAFADQEKVVLEHAEVVAKGRDESDQIVAAAEAERQRLLSETEVFRVARIEADKVLAAAKIEADELRKETDDYVDTRLATFEITLTKTLEAVARGRARLDGRSHFDGLGAATDRPSDGQKADLRTPDELKPAERNDAG